AVFIFCKAAVMSRSAYAHDNYFMIFICKLNLMELSFQLNLIFVSSGNSVTVRNRAFLISTLGIGSFFLLS
ncbi:hypothetical protein L9F63_002844, partial [Diploptera punctata]